MILHHLLTLNSLKELASVLAEKLSRAIGKVFAVLLINAFI